MQKAYKRTYWENSPSENTALNQDNLDNIEAGIDELDNRILTIDLTKLDKVTAGGMITGFALDLATGDITITYYSGSKQVIHTNFTKFVMNATWDSENQKLVLHMPDGSETYLDLSDLITQFEFMESDEIWFEVTADGKVKASIKDGSITEQKLRPNFLADIKTESAKAASGAQSASASANAAAISEANAKKSADSAQESEEKAKLYADNASAVTGIEIAKKDRAGIIKGGENYIGEDGELILTKRTTTPTLYNSHAGGVKVNGLGGASEQETTSGAQLYNANDDYDDILPDAEGWFTYSYDNTNGTAIRYTGINSHVSELIQPNTQYAVVTEIAEISGGTILNIISLSTDDFRGQFNANVSYRENGTHIAYPSTLGNFEDCYTMLRTVVHIPVGAKGTVKFRLSVIAGTTVTADTFVYEKFTGGQPSPNPEFPQEIKSVKGKNELDCRGLVEQTTNGVTFTPVYDAYGNLEYVNVNGIATDRANYSLNTSFPLSTGSYIYNGVSGGSALTYGIYIGGITYVSNGDTSFEVSDGTFNTYISVFAGATLSNVKIYPMIRKASIADPTYVPHGLLRIKGHGEQLFNAYTGYGLQNATCEVSERGKKIVVKGSASRAKISYTLDKERYQGKEITVSCNASKSVADAVLYIGFIVRTLDGKNTYWNMTSVGGTFTKTFVMPDIIDYIQFDINVNDSSSALASENIVTVENLMLSDCGITDWQPYTEQSIILSKPIELNGLNGVADELVSGTKRFATVVFDGSDEEGWEALGTVTSGVYRVGSTFIQDKIKYNSDNGIVPNVLCTHYRPITPHNTFDCINGITIGITGYVQIYDEKFNTSDISLWKAHLAEKPIAVTYELAEPIIEPLPTADQIALHSLMSYDGVTYLYCDSEIQPTWDLEYGTSKVGAYTFDALNTAKRSEILYSDLISAVLALNQE